MQDELKEKILALLNSLPKCQGPWTKGSGGHSVYGPNCGKIAKWLDGNVNFCDEHVPRIDGGLHKSYNLAYEVDYVKEAEQLQYAVQARHIPTEAIVLNKYQRDNLLWLLTLVWKNYLPGTNTGDWVAEIAYKLSPFGELSENDSPNRSVEDFLNGIIKDIIE